jgi:hypothetical protein
MMDVKIYSFKTLIFNLFINLFFCISIMSQENKNPIISYEDYAEEFIDADDDFLSTIEEWQNMIDQWLERPLCINNEEADWLMDYKIISLYQLNKLKEYRLIYGNLLSAYELSFIDGWDFQTVRKVIPLITVATPINPRTFKKFNIKSFRHSLVMKTAFNTQKSKGYQMGSTDENTLTDPMYAGPPVRLALRYDLEYRDKLSLGIRMEKDPGEPFLAPSGLNKVKIKTPDLFSGYLQIKRIGPVQSIILGDYRVSFGYGVNLTGGQSIKGRSGMSGMANRIRPQTSVSEAGFFRGAAICLGSGRFSLTGFGSIQEVDGTSILTDSLSGKVISFSSIDASGLHRTISELNKRKSITEKVAGGFLVYRNNWLKTGIIAMYNHYNARVEPGNGSYEKFDFRGTENLITGMSATIWMPKFQFFTEASVSRNKGLAMISGLQLTPVPGILISISHRNFAVDYQNWHGSGFISSGRNSNENGIQVMFRLEMPKKWLVEITSDMSSSEWASYDLDAFSRRREIKAMAEKAWPQKHSLAFSFRYLGETIVDPSNSIWIAHTGYISQYKLRVEARIEAMAAVRLKNRIECNLVQGLQPGWLIFQDLEFAPDRLNIKIWLRACFFDVPDYESRIYAYEHDVLYDFTSMMHYGKGIRGVLMFRLSPLVWMDLWLRLSTVYYTNKYIGSGWDEIEGNRQNEIELQVRIILPNQ